MVLTTISAVVFVVVFLADLFGLHTNPYLGIVFFVVVPVLFIAGLLLIPLGAWIERRRRAAGKAPSAMQWPRVDLNDARQRQITVLVFALTMANVVIVSLAAYGGVEYMDSVGFCDAGLPRHEAAAARAPAGAARQRPLRGLPRRARRRGLRRREGVGHPAARLDRVRDLSSSDHRPGARARVGGPRRASAATRRAPTTAKSCAASPSTRTTRPTPGR